LPGKTELGPPVAWQIVGVTGNVKDSGLDEEESPEVYVPYLQNVWGTTMLAVRAQGDPLQLANVVQAEIHTLDKDQPVTDVKTMEQIISESVSNQRFGTTLLSWFAAVALVLAAVGIYGVISFSVTQRTHEIGIRMALGATSTDVLRMVVGQGVTLALVGVAFGVGAAFALTRLMASMLFGITATDPLTFVITSAMLFAVALLACYVPARRATRVDPMIALRYE